MKMLICAVMCAGLSGAAFAQDAATAPAPGPETVKLGYELTLTHCKGTDCHTDSAGKGVAAIDLKPIEAGGTSGVKSVQMSAAGVNYMVIITATSQAGGRHVDVTMTGKQGDASGGLGSPDGMTFRAHEAANCVAWDTLPLMTLTADPYPDRKEQVTPALHLHIVQ